MRIVALDPGVTTGFAFCIIYPDKEVWVQEQISEPKHHKTLWSRIMIARPDHIVCESFTYQPRTNVILTSNEYIGVAHLFNQQIGTPLHLQSPASAKKLWTDDKLKKLGLWVPSKPHAMDATRHLLYFVTVNLKKMLFVNRLR